MPPLSTILVAGDQKLYRDLSKELAAKNCRLINAPRVPDALKRAGEATAIIVNAAIGSGAGEDLCRRLRADPQTARTLLFVRGTSHQRVPNVDEVLSSDLQHTLAVLESYLPELFSADAGVDNIEEASDEDLFDVRAEAEHWQRQSATEEWPPPPPERAPNQQLIVFAKEYAGYTESLNDGYQATDLSGAQRTRLRQMAQRVVSQMDQMLGGLQDGINEALRHGDLTHMRELSAAKNIAFARLQQLRGHVSENGAADEGEPLEARSQALDDTAPLAETEDQLLAASESGPAAPGANTTNKSRLTLAAEAKEEERSHRAMQAARQLASARNERGRRGALGSPLVWLLMIVLAVGGVFIWRTLEPGGRDSARPAGNQPPEMVHVILQEDASGVLARLKALDQEGDGITYTLLWSVNGEARPSTAGTRLPRQSFSQGQKIVVKVTPRDPWGAGQAMLSQPLMAEGVNASGGGAPPPPPSPPTPGGAAPAPPPPPTSPPNPGGAAP